MLALVGYTAAHQRGGGGLTWRAAYQHESFLAADFLTRLSLSSRCRLLNGKQRSGAFAKQPNINPQPPLNRDPPRPVPEACDTQVHEAANILAGIGEILLPTLAPELVNALPCSGWCKKQHVYIHHGMTEKAVIFFNASGWPIACRENIFDGINRVCVRWWRFDYSRPQPTL